MTTIAITYKAFQRHADDLREKGKVGITTARVDMVLPAYDDFKILDMIYKVTNLQDELVEFGADHLEISMWKTIKSALPANRSHTSLSIGDEIQIQDRLYSIEMAGFKLLADATNR